MRRRTLLVLAVVVPVGFALKYYAGPGRWWANNWGASFAYEMFFLCLLFLLVPRREKLVALAVGVCVATCALEFAQLWKPSWLEAVRATYVGRAVLGHAFSWRDLPAYPLGCLIGWLVLRRASCQDRDRASGLAR